MPAANYATRLAEIYAMDIQFQDAKPNQGLFFAVVEKKNAVK